MKKKIITVFLLVMFIISSAMTLSAFSANTPQDGLEISLSTDKTEYSANEDINVTLTVKNTNIYAIDSMWSKLSFSEGLSLKNGTAEQNNFSLSSGEEATNKIVLISSEEDTDDVGGFWYPGKTVIELFTLLFSLIALFFRKLTGKQTTALIICTAMLGTSVPITPASVFDSAAMENKTVTLSEEITVDGAAQAVTAQVGYGTRPENTVKISFDTDGGTLAEDIFIEKNTVLTDVPQSAKSGCSFRGWYTDSEKTQPFLCDEPITQDTVLYALFAESEVDLDIREKTTFYAEDCSPDMPFTLISASEITAENLSEYVVITALTGDMPSDFTVSASGNKYTVSAVGGYTPGCLYRLNFADGVTLDGCEESIREYTFRIYKDESQAVELTDDIIYISKTDMTAFDTDYLYIMTDEIMQEKKLEAGDTVCLGTGEEFTEDSVFLNITGIYNDNELYYIETQGSDISDVLSEVDIHFSQDIKQEIFEGQLDEATIVNSVYESGSVEKLTTLLASVLADNETVQSMGDGTPIYSEKDIPRDFYSEQYDFSGNAEITDGKSITVSELTEGLEITAEIGSATNKNFNLRNPDNWSAITINFSYEAELKNKVKVQASITVTEYLNLSMRSYQKLDGTELTFDYALNTYTQTELGFEVLVCSIEESEDDWVNITDEIDGMLEDEEDNSSDTLVARVRELLDNEGGYITFVDHKIIGSSIPFPAVLPVFSLNLSLDFVVKFNFAAGLSSNIVLLDAKQFGMYGNTAKKVVKSYTNELFGGDRYSMTLEACGYMGIKAGLEVELTLSFNGLSKLGKIGIAIEAGAYLDIYGYVRMEIIKPLQDSKHVDTKLLGGYYIEVGIYLEINLIASSEYFKAEAEKNLFEKKWPLFSLGNKYVFLSMIDSNSSYIMKNNTDSITEIPTLNGNFLDLTTGKIEARELNPSDYFISFSNKNFLFDVNNGTITANRSLYEGTTSAEAEMTIYYGGPSLIFSGDSAIEGYSSVATMKIYWLDPSIALPEGAAMKTYKVTFNLNIDGSTTKLAERDVLYGQYAGGYYVRPEQLQYSTVTEGWDKNPANTVIYGDTVFTYYATINQVLVAFKYYDKQTDIWKAQIRAVNVGSIPIAPEDTTEGKVSFVKWTVSPGMHNHTSASFTEARLSAIPYYSSYGSSIVFTGYDTTQPLIEVSADNQNNLESELREINEGLYTGLTFIYTAEYAFENCTYKVIHRRWDNEVIINSGTIPYASHITDVGFTYPAGKSFCGYALTEGGPVVYGSLGQLPAITDDVTYYAVYKGNTYTAELLYYDGESSSYKSLSTFNAEGGTTITASVLEQAKSAFVEEEGVKHSFLRWTYRFDGMSYWSTWNVDSSIVTTNVQIRPHYRKQYIISFDGGDGRLSPHQGVLYSGENSPCRLSDITAYKASDLYCDYSLIGWYDASSDTTYAVDANVSFSSPVTLVARYEATPREYTVTVTTAYGVLKNGEATHQFTGGYDAYLAFAESYEGWYPEDVVTQARTFSVAGKNEKKKGDIIESISYLWNATINTYTLNIYANGGSFAGESSFTYAYGTVLAVSALPVPTKSDETRDYIFEGWSDGTATYTSSDSITITGNTSLQAVWGNGTLKIYDITYILDGSVFLVEHHNYQDILTEQATPDSAAGRIFSGWSWSANGTSLSAMPERMPAYSLTVTASTTQCSVIYKLNGEIIENGSTFTDIGSTVTVAPKYEKTGYTVSDWATDDVSVTEGTFIMPERNVVFTATSVINTHTVTFIADGEIHSTQSAEYGSVVGCPIPTKSGYVLQGWQSYEQDINGQSFIMPDCDVTATAVFTPADLYVFYYLDGELYDWAYAAAGIEITVPAHENITGWSSIDLKLCGVDSFTMPDENIRLYAYTVDNTKSVTVNLNYDGQTYWSLKADENGSIELPTPVSETLAFIGWRDSNDSIVDNQFTVTSDTVDLTAAFGPRTYSIDFAVHSYLNTTITAVAGEKVYLPGVPDSVTLREGESFSGWYTADDVEIIEDELGKYFIMPERDIWFNAWKNNGTYMMNFYLISADGETIFVGSRGVNGTFKTDLPNFHLDGYHSNPWTDANGNTVYTLETDDFTNSQDFYLSFSPEETCIIEYYVNDGRYRMFETTNTTGHEYIAEPVLNTGEIFYGWFSNDVTSLLIENPNEFFTHAGIMRFYGYTDKDNVENSLLIELCETTIDNQTFAIENVEPGQHIKLPVLPREYCTLNFEIFARLYNPDNNTYEYALIDTKEELTGDFFELYVNLDELTPSDIEDNEVLYGFSIVYYYTYLIAD